MYSESELTSVYEFLRSTPEGSLKKMMVSGKMSDAHFRILMKVARACPAPEFIQHANGNGFPRIKLSSQEMPLKETLWPIALEKCVELGLLSKAAKAA